MVQVNETGPFVELGNASLNGYEHNALYRNQGESSPSLPQFTDVGFLTGTDRIEDGRSAAFTDIEVPDSHTAVIEWGDGETTEGIVSPETDTVNGQHRYSETGELRLEQHGDRWFIATDVVEFYDQSTPRAALRSFVRAMERQRYDIVLRLVPTPDKEGLTTDRMKESWSGEGREEVERMLSNLRNHLDNPIEIVGNHATMPYGDRMRVQFLREGESWKIEDPE